MSQYFYKTDYRRSKRNVASKALARRQRSIVVREIEGERFFEGDELNAFERDYLLRQRFLKINTFNIFGRRKEYFVRPRTNEGGEHFFLTMHLARYLKRHFKVWLYQTTLPDILFEFRNKLIAIEVETGKVLRDKQKFLNKVALCNENYGDDWFFVVTNRNLLGKYRKFGKTYTRKFVLKKLRWYVRNKPQKSQTLVDRYKGYRQQCRYY